MERQLSLAVEERRDDWRLDDETKDSGRRGIAEARQALAEARRRAAA